MNSKQGFLMYLIKNVFILLFLFFGANGYALIFKELHRKKNKTPADMFYLGVMYDEGEGITPKIIKRHCTGMRSQLGKGMLWLNLLWG